MSTPRPGRRVRGSESGRPIMALLDLLGRRWALRVGWELRNGPLGFRELQRRCDGVSPNLLASRLQEGIEAGTIEKDAAGAYTLTPPGKELVDLLLPLHGWAEGWARKRPRSRTGKGRRSRRPRSGQAR